MCSFLRDNNSRGGGDGDNGVSLRKRGISCTKATSAISSNGGLYHRLCAVAVAVFIFNIITTMTPCINASALVLMETPIQPPSPPPTQRAAAISSSPSSSDNMAAVTEANSTLMTSKIKTTEAIDRQTKSVAAAANITNNLSHSPYSMAAGTAAVMSTNSPPSPKRMPPPRVELNKCCLFGEYLDKSKTCIAGATDKWIPLIFLINRKDYYRPQGSSPKFITFQDNVFPISPERLYASNDELSSLSDHDNDDEDDDDLTCTVDDLVLFTGSNSFIIFSNGSLFITERAKFIPPSRYCVDQQAALVCFPKSKHPEPSLKLKKCCGAHGIYDNQKKGCDFNSTRNNQLNLNLPENVTYQTIYGFPECPEDPKTFAIAGDWSEVQLLSNETGHLDLPNHKINLSSSEYCLENLRLDDSSKQMIKVFACLHHFGKENTTSDKHQTAALNFGLVISVIFLAATLVASYMMPSIHHVLHWKCQIYYVFCLFIGDFLLAFSQLYKPLKMDVAMCQIVASVMHFFFLSAFFWLNTMCFNIWWTFRDFRPSSLERNQELIRLRLYSAYAWGIPLLIAAIAACVNLVPDSPLLRPGFGENSCWFNEEQLSIFAYFYGPVGILISINIMLFISTAHQLTCGLWKRDDVKSTTEKTALGKVCLKLVVVMGVTWIAEVLSWLIGGPNHAWFVTDLVNVLQGVFIFLVVGCQPQVWSACRRFCCPRLRQEITNTTNGVQHSSSSQGLPSMGACGGEITQNTSVHNTTLGGGGGGGTGGIGGGGLGNHIPATAKTMKIPMETVC